MAFKATELYATMSKSGLWLPTTIKHYEDVLDDIELTQVQDKALTAAVDEVRSLCAKRGVATPMELPDGDKAAANNAWTKAAVSAGLGSGTETAFGISENPYWEFDKGDKVYLYDKAVNTPTKKVEPTAVLEDGTEVKLLIPASSIVFEDGKTLQEKYG